jgi:soluble cytochrome b562
MKNKLQVNSDIYEKMIGSSSSLRQQIREKHKQNFPVSKEEADFVNDFEEYVKEIADVIRKQENLSKKSEAEKCQRCNSEGQLLLMGTGFLVPCLNCESMNT